MFLTVLTIKAKEWVEANLSIEDWQLHGNYVGIDRRYVKDIVTGMIKDGLTPDTDFSLA
jgi:hypothetical protein